MTFSSVFGVVENVATDEIDENEAVQIHVVTPLMNGMSIIC